MKAPAWQRYKLQLKEMVGRRGTVVGFTKTAGFLLLIEIAGRRGVYKALSTYLDPKIGDKIELVLRKVQHKKIKEPLNYCLKVQKI